MAADTPFQPLSASFLIAACAFCIYARACLCSWIQVRSATSQKPVGQGGNRIARFDRPVFKKHHDLHTIEPADWLATAAPLGASSSARAPPKATRAAQAPSGGRSTLARVPPREHDCAGAVAAGPSTLASVALARTDLRAGYFFKAPSPSAMSAFTATSTAIRPMAVIC